MGDDDRVALYFGYARGAGHFLQSRRTNYAEGDFPDFPWRVGDLDTKLLKNRKVPDMIDGRVHWTVGGRPDLWHAFFWWDRSGDKRGNSNSGFYVRGFGPVEVARANVPPAFEFACVAWPEVVARQAVPLVLVEKDGPDAEG